ncbi:MAG: NADH-quinone oxidoreductase subunit N [Nitrospinaceae bacterium]|nr:MAG: NADH-quinone oxidoreductase subunit N [Nitrospinaceae bacterium]
MEININFDDMNWMALGPELTVIFTALAVLLLGLKKECDTNRFLSMVALAGTAAALVFSLALWSDAPTAGNGASPGMFSNALIHDRFAQTFNIIFLIMSLFAFFGSVRYPLADNRNKAEYFALVLLAVSGMMFLAKSGTLITAFISLEIFSIALYILCGFSAKHGTGREGPADGAQLSWECLASQESTVKYLLTGAFASAILVYGMALIYAGTGTTEIRTIGTLMQENPYMKNTLVFIGMGLMFSGMAFKVSLVPFHSWTPDVYQGAPTPITGFMSVATKAAAFALIARVFFTALPDIQKVWMPILFGASALTMLVGNTAAIFQDNVKRMLAYSGVAHAGYLLIGIVANSEDGVASILFYLGAYLFMNVGAFAVLFILEGEGQDGASINRFKGLAKRNPLLAAAMTLFMLSLAGFPPTAGFFGKLFLFVAAIKAGYVLITIFAVIASVISVYFYLRVIVMMYFHESEEEPAPAVSPGMGALVGVSSLAIVAIGLFPSGFMQIALNSLPF